MESLHQEAHKIQLRSEEIQEILGKPPSWVAQWGALIVFIIFLLLLAVSTIITYPDKIHGNFTLKSPNTPINIKATMEGQVSDVLVKPNQKIKKGDALLVIQSNTKYKDVIALETILAKMAKMDTETLLTNAPPEGLQLGSLSNQYTELIAAYNKLKTEKSTNFDKFRINSIFAKKKRLQKKIAKLEEQINTENLYHKNAQDRFQKLKDNYSDKRITKKDMEAAQKTVSLHLEKILDLKNQQSKLKTSIKNLSNKSSEIQYEKQDTEKITLDQVRYNANKLLADIEIWKNNYVIKSPVNGHILFYPNIEITQNFFKTNDKILAIKPLRVANKKSTNEGHILVAKDDYDKIEINQPILISFPSHPSIKYGKVKGIVVKKTDLLENNQYIVSTKISNPPVTTKGLTIEFQNEMQGQAEIITENRSLFHRFFHDIL